MIDEWSGAVTPDEKTLLKRGMFWAVFLVGFWLSITLIHKFWVTVAAMIIWWVFMYVVFYRYRRREDSH